MTRLFQLLLIMRTLSSSGADRISLNEYGTVRGQVLHDTKQYLNIPYATPISAHNITKFQRPYPYSSTPITIANAEPQSRVRCRSVYANSHEDDDCLRMSIWVPSGSKSFPVIVILDSRDIMYHTWGEQTNNALLERNLMNGTQLSAYAQSVVIIVNYRVGPQGFSHIDDYSFGQNIGLLDVKMSLDWIGRYISFFSGDPAKITLMAVSSGVPVAIQTAIKYPGIIQQLVLLSGNPLSRQTVFKTQETSRTLLEAYGCSPNFTVSSVGRDECLQKIDISKLNHQARTMQMYDDAWTPESEYHVKDQINQLAGVKILIGVNENVGGYYSNQFRPGLYEQLGRSGSYPLRNFQRDVETSTCREDNLNGLQCESIVHEYWSEDHFYRDRTQYQSLNQLLFDRNLLLPVNHFLRYIKKYSSSCPYLFVLNHTSPLDAIYGALADGSTPMGAELQYLLGSPNNAFVGWRMNQEGLIMQKMMQLLSQFVNKGTPTGESQLWGGERWEPFDLLDKTYLYISAPRGQAQFNVLKRFRGRALEFWENILPRLSGIRETCTRERCETMFGGTGGGASVESAVASGGGAASPSQTGGKSGGIDQDVVLYIITAAMGTLLLLALAVILSLRYKLSRRTSQFETALQGKGGGGGVKGHTLMVSSNGNHTISRTVRNGSLKNGHVIRVDNNNMQTVVDDECVSPSGSKEWGRQGSYGSDASLKPATRTPVNHPTLSPHKLSTSPRLLTNGDPLLLANGELARTYHHPLASPATIRRKHPSTIANQSALRETPPTLPDGLCLNSNLSSPYHSRNTSFTRSENSGGGGPTHFA